MINLHKWKIIVVITSKKKRKYHDLFSQYQGLFNLVIKNQLNSKIFGLNPQWDCNWTTLMCENAI